MADNSSYQESFRDSVMNDLIKLGVRKTANSQLSGAARPSNIDENGNVIDVDKKEDIAKSVEETKASESSFDGYERGLIDAYHTLKKIVRVNHIDGYSEDELEKMFGFFDPINVLANFNIQDIMKISHEFELYRLNHNTFNKGDEILVSEEGYADDEYDRLVTLYTEDNDVVGFNSSGKIRIVSKLNCKSTGRNFGDLLEICKKMDEEDQ